MSRLIFSAVIFAYIWVERMLVCPISFDSVSMGTPLERHIVVAYECLLWWNRTNKAAVSKQVTIKRNSFEMSGFALFCQMLETQRSAEWRGISVTKPLAACYRSKDR